MSGQVKFNKVKVGSWLGLNRGQIISKQIISFILVLSTHLSYYHVGDRLDSSRMSPPTTVVCYPTLNACWTAPPPPLQIKTYQGTCTLSQRPQRRRWKTSTELDAGPSKTPTRRRDSHSVVEGIWEHLPHFVSPSPLRQPCTSTATAERPRAPRHPEARVQRGPVELRLASAFFSFRAERSDTNTQHIWHSIRHAQTVNVGEAPW